MADQPQAGASAALSPSSGRPGRLAAGLRAPLYANAFYVWVNQAGTGLAGFLFWALAARLYNADEVGRGAAAFGILTLLSVVSTLGLGLALIRFYPEVGAGGTRLINLVLTASAAAAILTAGLFLAGVALWAPKLDFLLANPFYALSFVVFVIVATLTTIQVQAFIALRQGRYILFQVLCVQLSRLALAAVLVGAFGLVAAGGVAFLLGGLASFVFLARALPGYRPAPVVDPRGVLKLMPFSLTNYLANFFIMAPALLVPAMVVNIIGSTQGAYFYAAWFIGYLPISFSTSLGTSLFAEGSHAPRALGALSRRAVTSALLIAAVAAILLLALAHQILLAFGSDYAREGANVLRIMALSSLPGAVVNVYLGTLRVLKRGRELVLVTGLSAVATLVLAAVLARSVGMEGAAAAAALGQVVGLLVVLRRVIAAAEGSIGARLRSVFAVAGPASAQSPAGGDSHS
ncbi:MAG TPA: lipopolysaccharide biosynthesis protein [Dehalococcoidia bacterium]|nr:lipopolysaccharide biosynthesis protein [Dehalococcoidia bacterium]